MGKKDDPCISICEFDGRTGWCAGCGRTVPEIKGWKKLSPFRKEAMRSELGRRVAKLATSPSPKAGNAKAR